MGKRGHHKKNLKKEKSKVKFKVGRTLPKGQNITDTSFKVKKIVIKEQLKSGGLEPVTKRNLNLKETLSRLQHYNTNMKLDNLRGLKEILTKNQDLLANNLLSVMENLASLITDKESSVRKESIWQLTCVIGQIPVMKLTPFVCLLCSYLGAALSHINKDIQEDALLLLDGILSTPNFPSLILYTSPATPSSSHPFDLILQGLLNQISEQKEVSNAEKPGWERKLNVDPEAKLADSQRRVKVLHQLRSLLKSALEVRKSSRSPGSQSDGPKSTLWRDVIKCGGYHAISEPSYSVSQSIALSRTFASSFNLSTSLSNSEPLAHGERLKEMVTALVPILLESWKEVGPCKQGSTNYELTVEAAGLLKIILDLLVILLEALMLCERDSVEINDLMHWFRISFSKPFLDILMPAFPFSCSGFHRKKNRKRQRISSTWVVENNVAEERDGRQEGEREAKKDISECFEHNLLMVQLFCTLELSKSSKKKDKKPFPHHRYLERILTFLTNSFEDPVSCHRHEKQMSAIIWSIVTCGRTPSNQPIQWRLSIDKIKVLIHALVTCCFKGCPYAKNSCIAPCHFFGLLCNILKERHLAEFHRIKSFILWVTKLPEMLCFPTKEAVEVLSSIARQCNLPEFHSTLKAQLPKIFFSLKVNPEYSNSEKNEKLKGVLVLLYWVQNWNAKELKSLGEVIQRYPKETSSLVELFRTRKEHLGQESEFSCLLESTKWWQKQMLIDV